MATLNHALEAAGLERDVVRAHRRDAEHVFARLRTVTRSQGLLGVTRAVSLREASAVRAALVLLQLRERGCELPGVTDVIWIALAARVANVTRRK